MDQILRVWKRLSLPSKLALIYFLSRTLKNVYGRLTEKSLNAEVAVITGAGSGIGRLLALKLALQEKVKVAVWDLNGESANGVVAEIKAGGGSAEAWACDVTDREKVYILAKEVSAKLGPVTMLVNNAGIVSGKKILEVPDALAAKTMEINAISHFWTIKAFLPTMLARNHGHIVTVASMAGIQGVAGMLDYCASKFAAVGINESLRQDLRKGGKTGVHTTVVCPYYINTGMFDGVKAPWWVSLFLPIMEPSYVVDRMVTAIKRNQCKLLLPPSAESSPLFQAILPPAVWDRFNDFIGANSTMDHFRGNDKSFKRS